MKGDMYAGERQKVEPYLEKASGPLYEQWYLLHHRIIRIVSNHAALAGQVRHFLYYAELLAEYSYEAPFELPARIPLDVLWRIGERLHRSAALTCYLFETLPGELFPPPPAEIKPDEITWEAISGVDGPLQARWKRGSLRFREYQAFPGVSSRVASVLDKVDLHATLFVEDVSRCAPWFVMRFVFYMIIGAMFGYDGYEIVHAAAVALDAAPIRPGFSSPGNMADAGALIIGSPGSGKSTLVLSCLQLVDMLYLADDVVFIAKDDGIVKVYAFPEDIGVRPESSDLLGHYEFMQALTEDERQKRFVAVQQYFHHQVLSSCPVRVMFFLHAMNRCAEFRAEPLTPAQAFNWLTREYMSRQRAERGEADVMFDIFSDMAVQTPSYRLWLTPDAQVNATQVRALLMQHI